LVDLSLGIEQLEHDCWPEPGVGTEASSLIRHAHAYRKIPLNELEPGHIRLLLGQAVGVRYVLPLAIDMLEKDPHVEGTYYPGDLLETVSRLSPSYWADENLRQRFNAIKNRVR
jgi:hypothetical protein